MRSPPLRRRLVVVWLVLAILVGAIVVLEYEELRGARSERGPDGDARLLLPVPVAELAAVEVVDAGARHRFERDAAGRWFYHGAHAAAADDHTHTVDPAAAERIEHALLALGRARIERHVGRSQDARTYGVTTPRIVILVYRRGDSQPLVQYAVGDIAPDTVSRYVDVVGGAGVVTIPTYQIDNLLGLIDSVTGAPAATALPATGR